MDVPDGAHAPGWKFYAVNIIINNRNIVFREVMESRQYPVRYHTLILNRVEEVTGDEDVTSEK